MSFCLQVLNKRKLYIMLRLYFNSKYQYLLTLPMSIFLFISNQKHRRAALTAVHIYMLSVFSCLRWCIKRAFKMFSKWQWSFTHYHMILRIIFPLLQCMLMRKGIYTMCIPVSFSVFRDTYRRARRSFLCFIGVLENILL